MEKMQDIEKTMQSFESDDYNLQTDIGYKFLLNWCLKKIAESFMAGSPLTYVSLEGIYARLEFIMNFFPYFGNPDTLKEKIVVVGQSGTKYNGFDALKIGNRQQRIDFYYHMLSVLRNIMKAMDEKKLLLHSYASVVFGYDGDLNVDEKLV